MLPGCFKSLLQGIVVTVFVVFVFPSEMSAQSKVVEGLGYTSTSFDDEIKYSIYLPAGYDNSVRSYPVLYLFHGFGNNENAWIQYGDMKRLMDRMCSNASITPMIVVMPNAGNSWFINDLNSAFLFESIFIDEFLDHIDSEYRTRKERKFRTFGGLSMGGYGALILAFRNPDKVSSVFSLSPGIWTDETIQSLSTEEYLRTFDKLYSNDPDKRLTEHWRAHSIHHQATIKNASELSRVNYYITSGDDDEGISVATAELHIIFKNRNVPHEYRVYDGGHTWSYWRKTFPEAVQFISNQYQKGVE